MRIGSGLRIQRAGEYKAGVLIIMRDAWLQNKSILVVKRQFISAALFIVSCILSEKEAISLLKEMLT
jgi:hypothetical protein